MVNSTKDRLLKDSLITLEYLMKILDYSGEEEFVTVKLSPDFFVAARDVINRAKEFYKDNELV